MGLAVGSPVLVVRSVVRIGASVVVVVGSAAALTLAVPFDQVTTEISARTAPNLLDLAIASCCALAGVYATIRAGSDTTSTAAGTAIGIARVPPLCVVGYGLGTRVGAVASGAGLLFTANLFFSVVGFLVLGYGRVDVRALEEEQLATAEGRGWTGRAARRLSVFFSSRIGPVLRVAMPVALVAAVYMPLRTALREVTWEVRARAATQKALAEVRQDSVQANVRVENHRIVVRLVAIETAEGAAAIKRRLVERIEAASGVQPKVEVVAVPDAAALERAQEVLARPATPLPPSRAVDLELARQEVEQALAAWPSHAVGRLAAWTLAVSSRGTVRLSVLHVGAPLGPAADALLATAVGERVHAKVTIEDLALDLEPATAPRRRPGAWSATARAALDRLGRFPETTALDLCIEVPAGRDDELVKELGSGLRDPRVHVTSGGGYGLRWSESGCPATPDAGVEDAGAESGSPDR